MGSFLDRFILRRSLQHWRQAALDAAQAPLGQLRENTAGAQDLRSHLNTLIHTAEDRLAHPRIGSNLFQNPHGTDWAWRPNLWRGRLPASGQATVRSATMLDDEVQLFHDCPRAELILRQLRNTREADLAPFGLRMEVFNFDGGFLSVAINLPPEALTDLTRQHVIRLDTTIECERPLEIFARLNIQHGPNTEQLLRGLPLDQAATAVEFDLVDSELNEKRLDKAWVDLIVESPAMNQVVIRDITFSRHLRANF